MELENYPKDIFDFIKKNPSGYKSEIKNPYLEDLEEIVFSDLNENEKRKLLLEKRTDLVSKYSFSIPFPFVINIIKKFSPIIELGAGTGYYSWCLKQSGAEVEAFDLYSPDETDPFDFFSQNHWFDDTWINVLKGDEETVSAYSNYALFLCWPPPDSKMAFNAFVKYKKSGGKTLIYIGDPLSSAEENFFKNLERHKMIHEMNLPSWKHINEKLMIYSL
ncbi:MAG: hypothetical protein H6681_03835 [Desulfobacteraceae bacterium]|nr:hypothetical protein [Desulfobacteraceae bacterium]